MIRILRRAPPRLKITRVPGNIGMQEQLGHRDQDPMLKDADSIFPSLGKIPNTAANRNVRVRKQRVRCSELRKALSYRRPLLVAGIRATAILPCTASSTSFAWTRHRIRQRGQGLIDDVQHVDEVGSLRIHIEHAGQHFALIVRFGEAGDGANLVGRIVVFFQLAQVQARAVVHRDFDGRAGIVFDVDVLEVRERN